MKKIKTPSFIIRKEKLENQTNDLMKTLSETFPFYIAGYSFKTNNFSWIISYMREKGLWAETVSSDEYTLAKSLGFPINRIIFNGPAKGKAEFIEAVENGAIVNIDSKRELKWLKECNSSTQNIWKIGLRVNFDIEEQCPGESQGGTEDGRFGFSLENGELTDAINFMIANKFPFSGIHLHCSSKTRSLNIYKAISAIAVKIVKTFNLNLNFLDIGGGFFGGVPGKPSFHDYFVEIKKILASTINLEKTTIIVEPGISLIGCAVDLTAVVHI